MVTQGGACSFGNSNFQTEPSLDPVRLQREEPGPPEGPGSSPAGVPQLLEVLDLWTKPVFQDVSCCPRLQPSTSARIAGFSPANKRLLIHQIWSANAAAASNYPKAL